MDEYIKREDALEITKRTSGDYATAFAEIRKSPAADVVPVVRCKDCKYAQNDYDGFSTTVGCNMLKCATGWHSFCSYGERKNGGADNG